MARVRASSTEDRRALGPWEFARVNASAAETPAQLAALSPEWAAAQVPGTVAQALRARGQFSSPSRVDLDDCDWWFRAAIPASPDAARRVLSLGGLATLVEAFVDGALVLSSTNMFLEHEVTLGASASELHLRFRSLAQALRVRRPRPRWKVGLFEAQQLRWQRTALLGRAIGHGPLVSIVGPWRPISLCERRGLEVVDADVRARVEGGAGVVEASVLVRLPAGPPPSVARLRVGDARADLSIELDGNGAAQVRGVLRLPDAKLWWPATHGDQPLYAVSLELEDATFELGQVGFRSVQLNLEEGRFELQINGERIFCKGAVWTTPDLLTLSGDPEPFLQNARGAGMNMLRISGLGVYESDRFYDRCDQLGLLVWQDFMFANLDYPAGDPLFLASVKEEANQQLSRLQLHPCVAILAGSSEVNQQAAMYGVDARAELDALFGELLPQASARLLPDVPYTESSAHAGGGIPRVDRGPSHYYGVGAYRRPLDDARRSALRFASECLAFSRVPSDTQLAEFFPHGALPFYQRDWMERIPRDNGASWSHEDVRDHYLRELFRCDPVQLRGIAPQRYLEASRISSGEVTARTIAELRRSGSTCAGALIYFLNDLWEACGFGLLDNRGQPKPAWHFARRAFSSPLLLTDEGLNGLRLHLENERSTPLEAELQLRCLREGGVEVAAGSRSISVAPRGSMVVDADELLGRFIDTSFAYRFGPPGFEVAAARLVDRRDGATLGEAFHLPAGPSLELNQALELTGSLERSADRSLQLTLRSSQFAAWVAVEAPGCALDDNYFHLVPGVERIIRVTPAAPAEKLAVVVQPFNARYPLRLAVAQGRT